MVENQGFSVRLLGHNHTSKSVKVPIFPLALNSAVAGNMTAQTMLKVLSFLAGCLQFEQTLYTLLTLLSLSMVSRNSGRIACSFNRSGSAAGLGVGSFEDTRPQLLPQARLVFSSFFTHTGLSESCWSSSGEAKSGFPANFFSRNRACLFLERANPEGDLFLFRRRLYWFHSSTPGYLVVVLGFVEFWRGVCN